MIETGKQLKQVLGRILPVFTRRSAAAGWSTAPVWRPYGVATLITALMIGLLVLVGPKPYYPLGLLLLLPVSVSAYLGGFWPGLLATCIALLAVNSSTLSMGPVSGTTGMNFLWQSWSITFAMLSLVVSALIEAMHRARARAEFGQRLYVSTLANIRDAVVTTDIDGVIQYLNPAAARLAGRDSVTLIGQRFDTVLQLRDATSGKPVCEVMQSTLARGNSLSLDTALVLVRSDATWVPVAVAGQPLQDSMGKMVGWVLTIQNQTERRQVETSLRERLLLQERFERITAVAPVAIFECRLAADRSGQLTYASPAFTDIFGVDSAVFSEDVSGWHDMVHADDYPAFVELSAAAWRELRSFESEHRICTAHRGVRWVSLSSIPSAQADGSTLWRGVFMDITARKQAEEQLRNSRLQLQEALDASNMGVNIVDLTTGSLQVDEAARRLWGLQGTAATAFKLTDLLERIHPDARESVLAEYDYMSRGEKPYSFEYHLLLDDGAERWLFCRGRIYRDPLTGHLIKVGVVMDATQQHHLEARRLHAQKLEALGVLAGGIAHDFNNLLLVISGNTRVLQADLPDADPLQVNAGEIGKAARRASDLVRRILAFSSVQETSARHSVLPMALRPMLDDVLGLARSVLPSTVALSTQIDESLPQVAADSSQLHQAVINLLTNAVDAAPAVGGTVRLHATVIDLAVAALPTAPDLPAGCYACITVSDNGNGMDPAVQQRIFDPFFTTKVTGRGTGLGLAIVHGIMKSVNGAVTVRSTPGEGSVFSLYFPASQQAPIITTPPTAATVPSGAAHILYVDDEESLVFMMTSMLQRMGHRVSGCHSPQQALETFLASPDAFDLIISDMAMPGMSGIELARRVLAARPGQPVIITSGYVDATDEEAAHRVGVRQVILKPHTIEELNTAIARLLTA